MALLTAPVAIWITPFSGPILKNKPKHQKGYNKQFNWFLEEILEQGVYHAYHRNCESASIQSHVLPMSAKSSSVSLSMRREATALIAMHTYHMLVNVRLASREHNHSGTTWRENERLGTHNVIPTANSECHTVTNKL